MAKRLQVAVTKAPIASDVRVNSALIREQMRLAAVDGAQLVVFAEGALSGYVKRQIRSWNEVDWPAIANETTAIASTAKELSLWVVFGTARQLGGSRPANSLVIINDQGSIVDHYDKRILSATEHRDWFVSGTKAVMVTIDGIKVGFAICIELRFPEIFAEMERFGADLVALASYSADPFDATLVKAQASLFNLYLAFSTPGNDEHRELDSLGVGPNGDELCRANCDRDRPAIFDVDPDNKRWDIALRKARPWRSKVRARFLGSENGENEK